MSTIHAGHGPARPPRPAMLRWGACLALTAAALTGVTSGVAAAAPDAPAGASAAGLTPPPLPTCVVSRVTTGPGVRTTITVTNHCSKPIRYRIIWTPRSPADPACHLLRPGGTTSASRPGRSTPRAVGCLHR